MRRGIFTMRPITAFVLFVLTLGTVAPLPGNDAKSIFNHFRPRICLVSYYQNIASQSRIGSFFKVKQYRIGIIVNDRGLIMVSSDVYPLSLDIISSGGASFFSGEPTDFKVKLHNGKEYAAEFIGKDDMARVAFIQISEKLPEPLPYVDFASTDSLAIGDTIYLLELLGKRYDFQPIFTPLIINAVIPQPKKKYLVNNYIPALSSCGLVIDAQGRAVGITLKNQMDVGFHTPSEFEELRKDYLEIAPSEWFQKLIETPPVLVKSVHRGKAWMGIRMQALTPELKAYWNVPAEGGVVLNRIYPDSPAERAGLKIGDIILEIDGKALDIQRDEDLDRFQALVRQLPHDATVSLKIFRKGKVIQKSLQLEAAPPAIDLAANYQIPQIGIEVRELTRDVLYENDLPLDLEGVYVYRVDRASPAGLGGLEIGDIILQVNYQKVKNLQSFRKLIDGILAENPKKIVFFVRDQKKTRFVFVDVH